MPSYWSVGVLVPNATVPRNIRERKSAMRSAIPMLLLIACLSLMSGGHALAGPAYVDSTGFAASGRDVVAYFALPATRKPAVPVAGRREFTATWNGATYAFASAANRDAFQADPARYAPQFDGHCAWAAGRGYKAPASPNAWRIVNGRLYLNYSFDIQAKWSSRTPTQIRSGEANWRRIDNQPAATGDAEDYAPASAPLP